MSAVTLGARKREESLPSESLTSRGTPPHTALSRAPPRSGRRDRRAAAKVGMPCSRSPSCRVQQRHIDRAGHGARVHTGGTPVWPALAAPSQPHGRWRMELSAFLASCEGISHSTCLGKVVRLAACKATRLSRLSEAQAPQYARQSLLWGARITLNY
jgi:hypothetical protein